MWSPVIGRTVLYPLEVLGPFGPQGVEDLRTRLLERPHMRRFP